MTLQRQCCECKFWEAAKPPDLGGSCLRGRICVIGAQSTQTLGHSMRESCPRKHHPKLLQSLAVRMQCGRQVRKDISSSLSLEGDQGKEGKLDIPALQCICNLLSSWVILLAQARWRKCFWHGRVCQCPASQGYMAKVTLSHHLLRDMTENLVKNRLTCHYSKSLFIWEQILVLDSDSTAAGFCSFMCVKYVYAHYIHNTTYLYIL